MTLFYGRSENIAYYSHFMYGVHTRSSTMHKYFEFITDKLYTHARYEYGDGNMKIHKIEKCPDFLI